MTRATSMPARVAADHLTSWHQKSINGIKFDDGNASPGRPNPRESAFAASRCSDPGGYPPREAAPNPGRNPPMRGTGRSTRMMRPGPESRGQTRDSKRGRRPALSGRCALRTRREAPCGETARNKGGTADVTSVPSGRTFCLSAKSQTAHGPRSQVPRRNAP